jgi:hypothetical protein
MTTVSCWCIIHTFLFCPTARQLDECQKCSVSSVSIGYGNQANGAYKERVVHYYLISVVMKYGTLNIDRIVATCGAGVMLVEQVLRYYMTVQGGQ